MIVQCQACQTRFRLADEKIKPGGTKVRCSKCKEIFTVTPPEPEPVEEAVDFGSFNMEAVSEETPDEAEAPADSPEEESSEPQEESFEPQEESFEPDEEPAPAAEDEETPVQADGTQGQETQGDELDFSGLEEEMGDTGPGEELAEEFSFADTSQPVEDDETTTDTDFAAEEEPPAVQPEEEESDFAVAPESTGEPGGPVEFDFGDDSSPIDEADSPGQDSTLEETGAEEFAFDSTDEETPETSEFNFEEDEDSPAESSGEGPAEDFAFGDEDDQGDENAFSFDDDSTPEWGDESPGEDSFDFDEPQFETDAAEPESAPKAPEEGGLQFGEIDFANDDDDTDSPGFQTEDSFAGATMETQEEPESFVQREQAPPSRDYDDEEPLPAPLPPSKKSSLSRILVLLVLLLVILGGAAGYLFMQEGSLNMNTVAEYLPFLKDYVGEPQEVAPGDRIGIEISGSSYVNGQAGQMLVIQGAAVNKHTSRRSSITIKGVLLDAKGKTLLQQTVFCGNALDEAELAKMPFSAIEEAMNNEFGDSLSNMNVAAGGSIPFTIVFRNLPAEIANINVEVVDSKPGGG